MKIIRCINGHFYDSDKEASCPYCTSQSESALIIKEAIGNLPHLYSYSSLYSRGQLPFNRIRDAVDLLDGCPLPFIYPDADTSVDSACEETKETVSIFENGASSAYITAWIVGISGEYRGQDYRIRSGMNQIGRCTDSDIHLPDLSEDYYCSILYEGRYHRFYLIPQEGCQVFLNGSPINDPAELHDGNIIMFGNCRFEFISYCRDGHSWDNI